MLVTPAKFEERYNAIEPREIRKPEDMAGYVVLQPESWVLIRDTLDSLGYGATIKKMQEAIDANSGRGAETYDTHRNL